MRRYNSFLGSPMFYIFLIAGVVGYWLIALALLRGL